MWRVMALAGAAAGWCDLLFAIVFYGARGAAPLGVMQSIAGGVLGRAADQGGAGTAALGVGLALRDRTGGAAVFYAASRRWPVLLRHALVAGAVFGVGVYFFMNWVVVPLSALGVKTYPPVVNVWVMRGRIPFVGWPIAMITRRAGQQGRAKLTEMIGAAPWV